MDKTQEPQSVQCVSTYWEGSSTEGARTGNEGNKEPLTILVAEIPALVHRAEVCGEMVSVRDQEDREKTASQIVPMWENLFFHKAIERQFLYPNANKTLDDLKTSCKSSAGCECTS